MTKAITTKAGERMRVIYISNCALHESGAADPFLLQEREWLLEHFDSADAVSYYGSFDLTPDDGFWLRKRGFADIRALAAVPFKCDFWRGLSRMRRGGALNAVNALKLFAFMRRGLKMHYWIERLLRGTDDSGAVLYSCWMSYDAYAAALSKRRHPNARFVARGHAFDIDTERNPMNPWLMKDEIAAAADGLYLISKTAHEQYMSYMRGCVDESKVHILAMGSGGSPVPLTPAPRLADGVMHIVSCSKIIEIKQVHIIAEALADWNGCPICWTHIGGGEGESELRTLCEDKLDRKENVIYKITGQLEWDEASRIYETRGFDLFVNSSRKEGVPVSIMEALHYGVPAIAPSVGGIPEMLEGGAGILYAPEDGAEGLRRALERFSSMSKDETEGMRKTAKSRWDERYQSARLLEILFPEAKEGGGK